jgi:hypothetical protein
VSAVVDSAGRQGQAFRYMSFAGERSGISLQKRLNLSNIIIPHLVLVEASHLHQEKAGGTLCASIIGVFHIMVAVENKSLM